MSGSSGVPRRWIGSTVAVSLVLAALGTSPSVGGGPSPAAVDEAQAARAAYGLPADQARVRRLMTSVDNVASQQYGFPLTAREHAGLMARNAYQREFQEKTLPHIRKLDGFAGTWVDQRNGGKMVVAMTKVTPEAKRQVRARVAGGTPGVRFVEVDDSAAELRRALARADRLWAALKTGIRPQAFGISHRYNRLVVKVLPKQLARARRSTARMARRSGVDVRVEAATRISDRACATRYKCYGPLQLGVRLNHPKVYDPRAPRKQWNCAVGFMLTNRTILTAGHCLHGRAKPWHGHAAYKSRYGRVGAKASSRYVSRQRDLGLIKLDDWRQNRSARIHGDTSPTKLTQPAKVIDNMDVCVSLARQDQIWCGRVTEPSARWWSETAGIWIWGAGMRFNTAGRTSLPGDSGSPVFSKSEPCPTCAPRRTPIGIVNAGNEVDRTARDPVDGRKINADVYFAKVKWAVDNPRAWPDAKIFTGPTSKPTPRPTPRPTPKPKPTRAPKPPPGSYPEPIIQPTPSPTPAPTQAPA